MLNLDQKKLKCALILGILFFVLSHPYLYKLFHKNLSHIVSFLNVDGAPTELGVFIMAILFVAIVYFGHEQLETSNKVNGNNVNNNGNKLLNKCRTYCQQVSNEMTQENAIMNNIANQNNNNQMPNNNGQMPNNNGQMPNNNGQMPNNNNGQMPNNNSMRQNNNNGQMPNNVQMNKNRMNNSMMNNSLNNVAQPPIQSGNLNNATNLGMDNMTGSTDMGLLNSQSCSDNPQCSGNPLVGGQGYDANLSNQNQGNMFTENTTYHDDMYASLF